MYGKFVREVQVKCGTFMQNVWSMAGLHAKYQIAGQKGELARQKTFGWPNERENCKPKYSWIAKSNPDGTPIFVSYFMHALLLVHYLSPWAVLYMCTSLKTTIQGKKEKYIVGKVSAFVYNYIVQYML